MVIATNNDDYRFEKGHQAGILCKILVELKIYYNFIRINTPVSFVLLIKGHRSLLESICIRVAVEV